MDEWQVAFVDDPGKRKAVLGAGCADEHGGGGGEAAQCAAGREMQMDAAESGDPCSAPTIRGFTADVLVIDEAAYIPHVGYAASRPMPAATQGDLVVMSSAHEPVGFFWDLMTRERPGASSGWVRKVVRARDMPRFSAAFLAEERRELGHEVYSREYDCEFGDVGSGIFQRPIVEEALSEDVKPLFKPKG